MWVLGSQPQVLFLNGKCWPLHHLSSLSLKCWPPHHLSSLSSTFSFPQLLRSSLTYVGIKLYFVYFAYSFYWSHLLLKIQSHSVIHDDFRLAMILSPCLRFLKALSCLTQNYFVWMSSSLHILCFGFLKHLIIQPHIFYCSTVICLGRRGMTEGGRLVLHILAMSECSFYFCLCILQLSVP